MSQEYTVYYYMNGMTCQGIVNENLLWLKLIERMLKTEERKHDMDFQHTQCKGACFVYNFILCKAVSVNQLKCFAFNKT